MKVFILALAVAAVSFDVRESTLAAGSLLCGSPDIASACSSSGAVPLPVEVLDRKATLGVAKVHATLNGKDGVYWVKTASLAD